MRPKIRNESDGSVLKRETGRLEERSERVGFEFFAHNVKLLITALERRRGASGPADCDPGSTGV